MEAEAISRRLEMPSQALADWRKCRAVELVTLGKTYDQIAREVGYANRGTAHRTVSQALTQRLSDDSDQHRELEAARLDALQAALWDKAMHGDVRAFNSVVRIIDRRCRLLGLHADKKAVTATFKGLVMTEEEREAWEAT
jgi:transposase-like protein